MGKSSIAIESSIFLNNDSQDLNNCSRSVFSSCRNQKNEIDSSDSETENKVTNGELEINLHELFDKDQHAILEIIPKSIQNEKSQDCFHKLLRESEIIPQLKPDYDTIHELNQNFNLKKIAKVFRNSTIFDGKNPVLNTDNKKDIKLLNMINSMKINQIFVKLMHTRLDFKIFVQKIIKENGITDIVKNNLESKYEKNKPKSKIPTTILAPSFLEELNSSDYQINFTGYAEKIFLKKNDNSFTISGQIDSYKNEYLSQYGTFIIQEKQLNKRTSSLSKKFEYTGKKKMRINIEDVPKIDWKINPWQLQETLISAENKDDFLLHLMNQRFHKKVSKLETGDFFHKEFIVAYEPPDDERLNLENFNNLKDNAKELASINPLFVKLSNDGQMKLKTSNMGIDLFGNSIKKNCTSENVVSEDHGLKKPEVKYQNEVNKFEDFITYEKNKLRKNEIIRLHERARSCEGRNSGGQGCNKIWRSKFYQSYREILLVNLYKAWLKNNEIKLKDLVACPSLLEAYNKINIPWYLRKFRYKLTEKLDSIMKTFESQINLIISEKHDQYNYYKKAIDIYNQQKSNTDERKTDSLKNLEALVQFIIRNDIPIDNENKGLVGNLHCRKTAKDLPEVKKLFRYAKKTKNPYLNIVNENKLIKSSQNSKTCLEVIDEDEPKPKVQREHDYFDIKNPNYLKKKDFKMIYKEFLPFQKIFIEIIDSEVNLSRYCTRISTGFIKNCLEKEKQTKKSKEILLKLLNLQQKKQNQEIDLKEQHEHIKEPKRNLEIGLKTKSSSFVQIGKEKSEIVRKPQNNNQIKGLRIKNLKIKDYNPVNKSVPITPFNKKNLVKGTYGFSPIKEVKVFTHSSHNDINMWDKSDINTANPSNIEIKKLELSSQDNKNYSIKSSNYSDETRKDLNQEKEVIPNESVESTSMKDYNPFKRKETLFKENSISKKVDSESNSSVDSFSSLISDDENKNLQRSNMMKKATMKLISNNSKNVTITNSRNALTPRNQADKEKIQIIIPKKQEKTFQVLENLSPSRSRFNHTKNLIQNSTMTEKLSLHMQNLFNKEKLNNSPTNKNNNKSPNSKKKQKNRDSDQEIM